jgi:hypothetical protein
VVAATARQERVSTEHTALDLRQWILANAGTTVRLVDKDGDAVEGELIGIPARSVAELEAADPASSPRLPENGSLVLVRTGDAIVSLPLDRVRDMVVMAGGRRTFTEEALRPRLSLSLERGEGAVGAPTVGLVYVQKGLRWIPSYRVDLDGAGRAAVQLEATLVDDLCDLDDATVHLVIGVPRFTFAGVVDPIALQATAAEVASRLQANQPVHFDQFLSNAVMTQTGNYRAQVPPAPDAPDVAGGEAAEDLFVFTVRHVTLRKGERMVLPVASFSVGYRDVFVLDVPAVPPQEARENLQGERLADLAKLLTAPKATHVLRLRNEAKVPLTTAPALVLSQGRVLAQGLLGYTPVGGESDLEINAAVDVRVEIAERETKREPNALAHNGVHWGRVDMAGAVELTNRKDRAIDLEVTRRVLGVGDEASAGGKIRALGLGEAFTDAPRTPWWGWWSWPWWWWQWNGVAEVRWEVRLEPSAHVELTAAWHYFWR